ncbi:hypothetical protein [Hydrogenophaga sp.]|uniref:hypothetical protein n=1 Tax=Hydrogenophaga sp. TaxID=1904254 RepID=UPI002730A6EF|nr:hypothetical protein [Hydrogenophaga sp.]MDP2074637.1 hypothetical protein [Hydrogenophaga sp.]MDP3106394.1 hypothetical protein [Hydrogenophaga sp.]
MLLETFDASMETAINDMAQRPRTPKPQTPAFSAWGVVRGAGRSVPAGVAEAGASGIELMSGLSKVDISPETMRASQTEEGRQEMQRRAQETLETGFRGNDVSASLRSVAEDYMPDPLTAHGAEMAVAEFGRLGTKALTAGVLLGPVAGAIVSGAEEGFTEAEKLARQGVDVQTRSKVGAVTGALTGLGFALPVAGKTVAGTVGLAVAGGPLSFVGQQAATREILENAGYDKLADQYDPFDPVGLTLSTLIPLGFGAMAMRSAARARGAAPDARPAEAPRETEAPPSERTAAARAVDELQVDAARVTLLRQNLDSQRLSPADDLIGAEVHNTAVTRALNQMATGQRVDVSDLIPPQTAMAGRVMDTMIQRLEVNREVLLAEAGQIPPAALVRQVQRELDELRATRPADIEDATQTLARQLEADEGLTPEAALARARQDTTQRLEALDQRIEELETTVAKAQRQEAEIATVERQIEQVRTDRQAIDQPATAKPSTTAELAPAAQAMDAPAQAADSAPARSEAQPADNAAPEQGGQGAAVESAGVARAAQELETLNPDLMVQLDGMDAPVRLADLMAKVRQEVADDLAELPLIETAATCFLRT